jgi:hypothetical protein
MFVERVLPDLVLPQLSDLEMAEYRRPFLKSEDRWPTLTWARQIPIAGTPADVVAIADGYSNWMSDNDLPKLFVNAELGTILTGQLREFCRRWERLKSRPPDAISFRKIREPTSAVPSLIGWKKATFSPRPLWERSWMSLVAANSR